MSLVGNLEDLSLGDLLQIVSLSQKSGVLEIASAEGRARIFFRSGLVHAAGIQGESPDLRGLMVGGAVLDPAGFDAALSQVGAASANDPERIARAAGIDLERIEALVRKSAEQAILAVFTWQTGEFSFDARKDEELERGYPRLGVGINPQFLAMEGMRLRDERAHRSGGDAPAAPAAEERGRAVLDEPFFGAESLELDGEGDALLDLEFEADAKKKPAPPPVRPSARPTAIDRPVVVIDPEADALEWVKGAIGPRAARVHVFQRAEQGLARIRQYLIRGEVPCVLMSPSVPIDPLSGIHGLGDFIRRLRAQAPRILILGVVESAEGEGASAGSAFDGVLVRPTRAQLRPGVGRPPEGLSESLVDALAAAVAGAAGRSA